MAPAAVAADMGKDHPPAAGAILLQHETLPVLSPLIIIIDHRRFVCSVVWHLFSSMNLSRLDRFHEDDSDEEAAAGLPFYDMMPEASVDLNCS
ncbi:hypothetical protein SAY86_024063 [Trapa natans]|uniref:Uncharacterized protein n=1 Tax=Trapa natans TaxID=22666 RepID=A0AAN7M9L1_TRANT|nr:hypothetical protein SAY86_024063 [Trapa natans]